MKKLIIYRNIMKKIIINNRDLKIFCYLFEQKVALQVTIHERFFSENSRCTTVKRLQKLLAAGFLRKKGQNVNGKLAAYYFLSPKGFEMIKHNYTLNSSKPTFKSDSIEHDLELSLLRNRLEKFTMLKNYYSENYLQNCLLDAGEEKLFPFRDLRSDAVLSLELNQGSISVALEYERTKKTENRYIKKLVDYHLKNNITAVFYVCKNRRIRDFIEIIGQGIDGKFSSKIYTALSEKIPEMENIMEFKKLNKEVFILK